MALTKVSGSILKDPLNLGGEVSIGGTLTYQDVTNVDAIGIITARSNIDCNGDLDVDGHTNLDNVSIAGVSTFSNNIHTDSSGVLIVAGTTAYSDGTFGQAKLQFNTKIGNHIGACSVADSTNNITHVLFKNPNGAIASVGTHNSDFIALTGNSERLRIDSTGRVIIANGGSGGTADTNADNFVVKNYTSSGSCGISILNADNQNSTLYFGNASDSKHAEIVWSDASNLFLIGTSNAGASIQLRSADQSDALRITSDGEILIGHTSSPTSDADKLQVISTASGTGLCLHNYSASSYGNQIAFMKSRNGTIGSNTILQNGDRIGELNFYGNDGSGRSLGAQISVRVNGTPSNNNTPAAMYFMTGLNQSMDTRLSILPAGTVGISKNGWASNDHSFGLTVHTGSTSETGPVPDGIMIVSQQNNGNQNSSTGKLMFCGHAQTNGPFLYGDNALSYGKKDLVFHTLSTANDYTTQLEETARFTYNGRFGLGTGVGAVDSLMHIQGNSDSGDEYCQLTIEDEDTTSGSQVPSIMFKGNGSQLCKIRATSDKPIRIYDKNNAERWLINDYGETISEESDHGWSTYEMHSKNGGTRFHYRRVATGASGTTINLIRVRRHYWGSGNYKIKVRQTYYNGSYESHFWLNGHAANGANAFSLQHQGQNGGNSSWIQKTAASHSAPGNNYAGWTDVFMSLGAYEYYEIIIEASLMPDYSHNINSLNNDGYALHAF